MYVVIGLLALFVLSSAFILEHGGSSLGAVQTVTIHDLTLTAPNYQGSPVTTEGTLTYSDEHDRYQLSDDGNFAIIIRHYSDEDDLAEWVGQRVRISGIFGYEKDFGVYIDAEAAEEIVHPTGE
jgi:hypothetical protein